MSLRLDYTFIGVSCFVLGYALSFIINSGDNALKSTSLSKPYNQYVTTNDPEPLTSKVMSEVVSQDNNTPTTFDSNVGRKVNTAQQNIVELTAMTPTESFVKKQEVTTNQDREEIIALKEWATSHKESIETLITTHVPSNLVDGMSAKLSENNDFINNPELMQTPAEDDNWSYNMEQTLTHLLLGHQLSQEFELLNLTCKQLTCDILAIDKARVWMPLYIHLLTNEASLISNQEKAFSALNYIDGNVNYLYTQLNFKGS
jgi:hypothetical protein